MNITDRLKDFCDNKKIKNVDLVNIGCGSQQTVSFVMNGKQKPNTQFLEIFAKTYPDLDVRWLLTGDSTDIVEDIAAGYGLCRSCIELEGVIKHLKSEIAEYQEKISERDRQIGELKFKYGEPPDNRVKPAAGRKAS